MSGAGSASGDSGVRRAIALDATALGLPGPTLERRPVDWSDSIVAQARGPLRGLGLSVVSEAWREALAWAGTPLMPGDGDLRWGADLEVDPTLTLPTERDGRLWLPPIDRFLALTAPQLRPLRLFIAHRLGVRVQVAAGVRVWLWQDRAVLVSCRDEAVGGFLYGPTLMQRTAIELDPGGWQMVVWK
jgi:hypothetical protein